MKLWTVQDECVWELLESKSYYRTFRSYLDPWWARTFADAYIWMAEQMKTRVGPPRDKRQMPIWAWRHWRGDRDGKRDRPDLRVMRHNCHAGAYRLIEFEAEKALLSDFAAWHAVMDQSFLSLNEKEYDEFYAKVEKHRRGPSLPKSLDKVRRKSWERVFDLEGGDPAWRGKPEERAVQACVWEIRLEDVTNVTRFKGTGKPE